MRKSYEIRKTRTGEPCIKFGKAYDCDRFIVTVLPAKGKKTKYATFPLVRIFKQKLQNGKLIEITGPGGLHYGQPMFLMLKIGEYIINDSIKLRTYYGKQ